MHCTYVRHVYNAVCIAAAGVLDELDPSHVAYGVDEVRICRTCEDICWKCDMDRPVETVIGCNEVGANRALSRVRRGEALCLS